MNETYGGYSKDPDVKPVYDLWLDKYGELLEASRRLPILDLGCGSGADSLYLTERGYSTVSCDISEAAIEKVKKYVPEARCMRLDMQNGLPFDDGSFQIVLADLSLHYFSWDDTVRIVRDIARVLKTGGALLCRLNSTNDFHHGAGQGDLIEENYYFVNGASKRFFDRARVEALFQDWELLNLSEYRLDRFRNPKLLWEAAMRKQGD